eukprot:jgi/Chrzof1/7510/Cz02g26130.t1
MDGPNFRPSQPTERIYSTTQLLEALHAASTGLKDQLQVLSILDGTAISWPGVSQAMSDLTDLVDLCMRRTAEQETATANMEGKVQGLEDKIAALTHNLAATNNARKTIQTEAEVKSKKISDLERKLGDAQSEIEHHKKQIWDLEKSRADLATEVEKLSAEAASKETEMRKLRTTITKQSEQISQVKEQLAVRTTEVSHLEKQSAEQNKTIDHVRSQLEACQASLKSTQGELAAACNDKSNMDKDNNRLQKEVATLAAAITKSQGEVSRLKEWQDVFRRSEASKLAEAHQAADVVKADYELKLSTAANEIKMLTGQVASRDEEVAKKEKELTSLQRQLGLWSTQLRDAQNALNNAISEKAAMSKVVDEKASEIFALRQELSQHAVVLEKLKNECMSSEHAAREACNNDRSKLQSQLEEALREAAVQRVMAEAWQRDLKAFDAKVKAAESEAVASNKTIDQLRQQLERERVSQAANSIGSEQMVRDLRLQLENRTSEVKRIKFDMASQLKQYEQALQRARREADAGAQEIQRLRGLAPIPAAIAAAAAAAAGPGPAPGSITTNTLPALIGPNSMYNGKQQQQQQPQQQRLQPDVGYRIVAAGLNQTSGASIQQELARLRR